MALRLPKGARDEGKRQEIKYTSLFWEGLLKEGGGGIVKSKSKKRIKKKKRHDTGETALN